MLTSNAVFTIISACLASMAAPCVPFSYISMFDFISGSFSAICQSEEMVCTDWLQRQTKWLTGLPIMSSMSANVPPDLSLQTLNNLGDMLQIADERKRSASLLVSSGLPASINGCLQSCRYAMTFLSFVHPWLLPSVGETQQLMP